MKKIFILSACAALAVVLVGFAVFQWFRIVGAALGDDAPPYYAREPEADNFTWPELPRDNGDGGDYIPEPAEPVEPPEEPEPTPQPTPTPFPEPIAITSVSGLGGAAYRGGLELPVAGATGWAAAYIYLLSEPRLPPPPPEEVYEEIYEDIYEDTYEDIYENYVYEECHYNYEAYYYEVYPCEDCDEIYAYDEYPAAEYPQYYEYLEPVEILAALSPGQAFVIILAYGDWWYVKLPDGLSGWVLHSGCFINLPDVIPSIVYRISNAYYSLKRSGEYEIPNISGQALYSAWAFNPRLGRY
ncbi:MAG: hypothetical protein FWB91_09805, partial [Defluviitaleaceae bacterium]|nr:hypothetical protein [Defluviitaleaceae bacterium]